MTVETAGGPTGAGFASIIFDCDSTLVRIEGIDELAGPRIDEIRRMTDLAMRGELALEEVYGRRLAIIDPSREEVAAISQAYRDTVVDHAREVVAALLWLEKEVRVVSGGLRPPVEAIAGDLGIPADAVAAVGISFDGEGRYLDFERDSPLTRSGGKADVISGWLLPRPSLLVGDGATDLEARPAVDCFAAFMGVAHRETVASQADVVIDSPGLAPVLSLAASPDDRRRLRGSPWEGLLRAGDAFFAAAGEPGSGT